MSDLHSNAELIWVKIQSYFIQCLRDQLNHDCSFSLGRDSVSPHTILGQTGMAWESTETQLKWNKHPSFNWSYRHDMGCHWIMTKTKYTSKFQLIIQALHGAALNCDLECDLMAFSNVSSSWLGTQLTAVISKNYTPVAFKLLQLLTFCDSLTDMICNILISLPPQILPWVNISFKIRVHAIWISKSKIISYDYQNYQTQEID